jgi:transcriptional regulator with XRE-family HTH domain
VANKPSRISRREAQTVKIGPMPAQERVSQRGRERAGRLLAQTGAELRAARLGHDVPQALVAAVVGVSQSYYSRMERGAAQGVTLEHLSVAFQAVGHDLSLKAYPSGLPVRDKPQLELLGRLRTHVHARATWKVEVPLRIPGDQRAWDAVIGIGRLRIGVEAETRIRDVQAVERRVALKKRDDGVDRVILLVRATRSNRAVLRAYERELLAAFPVTSADALAALADGRDPGSDAIILL